MPHYSVATTKDQLSSLIDKALAGEEVIITRRGKPMVELVRPASQRRDRGAAMDRLGKARRAGPKLSMPSPALLKLLDDESSH